MEIRDYLRFLVEEMHRTVVATVDDAGLPVTSAIDMLDWDDSGVYFLTAKGKGFYDRLSRRGYLSLTAMKGSDTMSTVSLSLRGKVRCLGNAPVNRLLEKNPYLFEIYPTAESRQVLEVFQVYQGTGEWFDLSVKPIQRASFSFGNAEEKQSGFFITDACLGCGICAVYCPQNCMDFPDGRARIRQANCLHCGKCMEVCPAGAVEKRN